MVYIIRTNTELFMYLHNTISVLARTYIFNKFAAMKRMQCATFSGAKIKRARKSSSNESREIMALPTAAAFVLTVVGVTQQTLRRWRRRIRFSSLRPTKFDQFPGRLKSDWLIGRCVIGILPPGESSPPVREERWVYARVCTCVAFRPAVGIAVVQSPPPPPPPTHST